MGSQLPEIDADRVVDPADFRREIAENCRPVVLRGGCRDWPARAAAAQSAETLFAYLRAFDSGQTAQAFIGAPEIAGRYHYGTALEGFNFAREELGLAALFDRMAAHAAAPDRPSIYMGSLPVDAFLPGFAEANRLAMLPGVASRIWLGNASNIACHFDTFDNIACAVMGRRRFTLYAPETIGSLYVGPLDHTMAGQPVGLAVGSEPGDPRYPRFEAARDQALVADLEPGDALYLPKLWWHQVEARDPINILVNYWWDGFASGPDAPFTTMLLAMIAIAERPGGERAAWRAFFDHYVFRSGGHPLAHLPPEKHGILGPLRGGAYGRVRTFVMQMLRGG